MIGLKENNDEDDDKWTRTNIQALSGIRIRGLNDQTIKAYASSRAATGNDENKERIKGLL
jgi:hypothetical protein